jgi:hypothetical protein
MNRFTKVVDRTRVREWTNWAGSEGVNRFRDCNMNRFRECEPVQATHHGLVHNLCEPAQDSNT